MGSVGNQTTSGERVVNFGNGSYMKEIVSYKGIQMPREDARRIDKIKDDLGYLSYKVGNYNAGQGFPLSEQEKQQRTDLENELRRYAKKYGDIGASWYLPKK